MASHLISLSFSFIFCTMAVVVTPLSSNSERRIKCGNVQITSTECLVHSRSLKKQESGTDSHLYSHYNLMFSFTFPQSQEFSKGFGIQL